MGMTSNLDGRLFQHRNKTPKGFTAKYNVSRLVFCEAFNDVRDAIAVEKRIKAWRREKKVQLIEKSNPEWNDLSGHYEGEQANRSKMGLAESEVVVPRQPDPTPATLRVPTRSVAGSYGGHGSCGQASTSSG